MKFDFRKSLSSILALIMLASALLVVPSTAILAEDADADAEEEVQEEVQEEKESLFDAYDLGGATIRAMNINSLHDANPDADDDELEDFERQERQEHLDYIEEKYNCKIEFVDGPEVEWHEVPNELVKQNAAGTLDYDIMDYSYTYMMPLVNNNVLLDTTDFIYDLPFARRFIDTAVQKGRSYGIATFVGGEGLLYNRDMIQEAGMEMEPNEMFATGQWSYDDFQDYLTELKANLPEGTYPFFIDPYYWFLFAPAANGTSLLTPEGNTNYQDPAVIETLEFLKTIYDAGLVREPNYDEEGNPQYWGTPGETFEKGVEVAMCHRASWQTWGLVDSLNFGFVPYPWGKEGNVTVENVGDEDAYKTLQNYAVTVYDAQTKSLTNNVDPEMAEGVMVMFMDLIKHDFIVEEYLRDQGGEEAMEDEEIDPRWFSTELDAELYEFSINHERLERYSVYTAAVEDGLSLAGDYYDVFTDDAAVRSVIDAATPVDQAKLEEAGVIMTDEATDDTDETAEAADEAEDAEDVADDEVTEDEVTEDEVVEDEVTEDEVVEDDAADEESKDESTDE